MNELLVRGFAIVWIVAVFMCLFMYDMIRIRRNKREARTQKKEQVETEALLKKWTGARYLPEHSRVVVLFLNSASKLIRLPLVEFRKLSVPECDFPKAWVVCFGYGTKLSEADQIFLVNEKGEWKFCYSTTLSKSEYSIKDNHSVYNFCCQEASTYEEAITQLLAFVLANDDGRHAWIQQFQAYASPILLNTKGSMGESKSLGELRRIIERGPTSYDSINSLFPKTS